MRFSQLYLFSLFLLSLSLVSLSHVSTSFAFGDINVTSSSVNPTTHNFSVTFSGRPDVQIGQINIESAVPSFVSKTFSINCTGQTSGTCTGNFEEWQYSGTFPTNCNDQVVWTIRSNTWVDYYSRVLSVSDIYNECTPPAAQIVTDPSNATVTVGTPFTVNVNVDSTAPFNAAKATVEVSSNLDVAGVNDHPVSNACGFTFVKRPSSGTTADLSFAGAVMGGSSTACTVYTMTLIPNSSSGQGTIHFSDGSIKASSGTHTELLTGYQDASFTIQNGPSPTPTVALTQPTVTSPNLTYRGAEGDPYLLTGTYTDPITHVFVGSSEADLDTQNHTWSIEESLSLGSNNIPGDDNFTIYGSDGNNQTATQVFNVKRHFLGDISGDGHVTLTDVSLFASDWNNQSTLNYALSDLSNPTDGDVDMDDRAALAAAFEVE